MSMRAMSGKMVDDDGQEINDPKYRTVDFRRWFCPRSKPVTDFFTRDTNIDRRKCHRVVPMKVLVLGVGRTGTTCKLCSSPHILKVYLTWRGLTALRIALKRLGYVDTYHMMSASIENPMDCLMWQAAFAAKYDGIGTFGRKEWDQLLGHCQVSYALRVSSLANLIDDLGCLRLACGGFC
jgi:hypothetical protein